MRPELRFDRGDARCSRSQRSASRRRCCSTPPVAADHPRRCRDFTRDVRRATRPPLPPRSTPATREGGALVYEGARRRPATPAAPTRAAEPASGHSRSRVAPRPDRAMPPHSRTPMGQRRRPRRTAHRRTARFRRRCTGRRRQTAVRRIARGRARPARPRPSHATTERNYEASRRRPQDAAAASMLRSTTANVAPSSWLGLNSTSSVPS